MSNFDPELERFLEEAASTFARGIDFSHTSFVRKLGLVGHFTDRHWTVRWVSEPLLLLLGCGAERYLGKPVSVVQVDARPLIHRNDQRRFDADQKNRVAVKANERFLPEACYQLSIPAGNRYVRPGGEYFAHIRSIPVFAEDMAQYACGTFTLITLMSSAAFPPPINSSLKDQSDAAPN